MVEIMSSAKLHAFPTIALVLFLLVFAGVMWRALRRGARADQQHLKQVVLDEEVTTTHSPLTPNSGGAR